MDCLEARDYGTLFLRKGRALVLCVCTRSGTPYRGPMAGSSANSFLSATRGDLE